MEELGADVHVVEGARGEFSTRVDDRILAQKSRNGLPNDAEIIRDLKSALGKT